MDYIRQLGPVVLDHRFRRMTETLLRSAEQIYEARGLPLRGRWASTYQLLYAEGPLAVGQIADRLRLTHPGVIGITDEMIAADIVSAVRDPGDARRRILALTTRGRRMSAELFSIWTELGRAQRNRFAARGCDIMAVLEQVEDGLTQRPLATEVLEKLAGGRAKKTGRSTADTKRKASPVRRAARAALCFLAGVSILSAYSAASIEAQSPAENRDTTVLDAAARAALVNALSDSLVNGYIYEKTGRMLADSLKAELRSGAYDGFVTGDSFAQRVTQTLRRISNDRHLGVMYGMTPQTGGPMRRRVRAPADSPPAAPAVSPSPAPGVAASSRVISMPEYGFESARILPGNIGYLDLRGFSGEPGAIRAVDSVMALFANTKAIIIDVGRNRGGGPQVIQHLSAYLFDKPTHLVTSYARGMDAPIERWTTASVPGKRLPKTPVYVLTSRSTISAAESFAFGLKNHNRITIVGERTAGGGHFGAFVPLTPGFSMFLPRGRTYDPRTNEGWEAEGLKPDVDVPYDKALETALTLARKM
jgi:DNA-binding MarR family transcriptional regulator